MSSKVNHRRGHGRIQERGPCYENANPAAGCNSTHVARSRAKWKKRAARAERRTGAPWSSHFNRRIFEPLGDALKSALEDGFADAVDADFSDDMLGDSTDTP